MVAIMSLIDQNTCGSISHHPPLLALIVLSSTYLPRHSRGSAKRVFRSNDPFQGVKDAF